MEPRLLVLLAACVGVCAVCVVGVSGSSSLCSSSSSASSSSSSPSSSSSGYSLNMLYFSDSACTLATPSQYELDGSCQPETLKNAWGVVAFRARCNLGISQIAHFTDLGCVSVYGLQSSYSSRACVFWTHAGSPMGNFQITGCKPQTQGIFGGVNILFVPTTWCALLPSRDRYAFREVDYSMVDIPQPDMVRTCRTYVNKYQYELYYVNTLKQPQPHQQPVWAVHFTFYQPGSTGCVNGSAVLANVSVLLDGSYPPDPYCALSPLGTTPGVQAQLYFQSIRFDGINTPTPNGTATTIPTDANTDTDTDTCMHSLTAWDRFEPVGLPILVGGAVVLLVLLVIVARYRWKRRTQSQLHHKQNKSQPQLQLQLQLQRPQQHLGGGGGGGEGGDHHPSLHMAQELQPGLQAEPRPQPQPQLQAELEPVVEPLPQPVAQGQPQGQPQPQPHPRSYLHSHSLEGCAMGVDEVSRPQIRTGQDVHTQFDSPASMDTSCTNGVVHVLLIGGDPVEPPFAHSHHHDAEPEPAPSPSLFSLPSLPLLLPQVQVQVGGMSMSMPPSSASTPFPAPAPG